jgi:hypothetical protein
MVRFERNGAPVLDNESHEYLFDLEGEESVEDIDQGLLAFHFRTCLLWHVAGFGRSKGK